MAMVSRVRTSPDFNLACPGKTVRTTDLYLRPVMERYDVSSPGRTSSNRCILRRPKCGLSWVLVGIVLLIGYERIINGI